MKGLLRRFARGLRSPLPGPIASASPLVTYVNPADLEPLEHLLRLGSGYGGWLIPVDCGLDAESVCYLAGAGEDISFDCELVRRYRCKVRIVDPTPRAIEHFHGLAKATLEGRRFAINNSQTEFYSLKPADIGRMTFLPVGLADRDGELKLYLPKNPAHVSCSAMNLQKTTEYITTRCYRLPTLLAQQGDSTVDLLKMDIEGSEYSVIRDIVASRVLPRVLLVEFDEVHTPLDADADERISRHIGQLTEAGMRCIALDGSNATFVRAR